jgi:glycine cleavage system regulatory protein
MPHVIDQIEAYIAGGLSPDERLEFDQHIAGCASCAAALKETAQMDAAMNQLFALSRPAGGFEDRLIQGLRNAGRRRRWVHPMVRRVATGVAAAILVASVGYVGNTKINHQELPSIALSHQFESNIDWVSSRVPVTPLATKKNAISAQITDQSALNEVDQKLARRDSSIDKFEANLGSRGRADEAKLGAIALGKPAAGGFGGGAANRPAAIPSGALPMDDKDSVLLPTDDKDGDAPPKTWNFQDSQKRALDSYYKVDQSWNDQSKTVTDNEKLIVRYGDDKKGDQSGGNFAFGLSTANGNVTTPAGGRSQFPTQQMAQGQQDKLKDVVRLTQQQVGQTSPVQPLKATDEIVAGAKLQQDAPAQTPPPAPPSDATPTNTQPAVDGRKIIRNGEMEFEVDSFDSAVMQISKIAAEEGGFVSTTESDKLPNGKVKGRVVLRVPPQRLDTLVLKLRGIGDLRTQRIGAQDVTKQYTDTESALRAAKAMQERLLDIIKNGKGAVKDLLEAEKQLGVWREKIEQLEGEIRYYNNLISLSTLSVNLMERDIKNPAFASETETVAMSLETEKVEDDYQKARDAIAEAKGRITASELKQFDAGQYRATISALLPPDAAEAVIARVRQLDGRLAHFERQRSQSTSTGEATRNDTIRLKREDVVLNLTIYNLANIAPRRTTTLLIVAPNVEEAYRNLIEQVNSSGGRVITSTIARPKPDQTAGNINFNVPADKADILLAALRGAGEVIKADTSESPDTQNVTESKRGFSVTISSLSAFAARETQQVQLAAPAVSDAFNEVLNAVRGKDGRVIHSQLNEQDPQNVTGTIEFEAPRDSLPAVDQAFRHSSEIVSRIVTRSTDTENTVDTKVHFTLTVSSADRLPARESLTAQLAATDVTDAYAAIRAAVPKGGHILTSELNEQDPQNVSAHLVFDLPQAAEPAMQDLLKKNTAVLSRQVHRVPEGQVAVDKLRVELTLVAADRQPPRQIVHLGVQVSDVEKARDDLVAAANSAGGRQSDNPSVTQDSSGHTSATITVDVPADKLQTLLDQIDHMGNRRTRQLGLNTQVPETKLSRAQVQVTFSDSAANLGGQESMADYVRNGLLTSLKGLGYSLMWIIIGVCLIAPWALLIWGAWRLARRNRGPRTAPTA